MNDDILKWSISDLHLAKVTLQNVLNEWWELLDEDTIRIERMRKYISRLNKQLRKVNKHKSGTTKAYYIEVFVKENEKVTEGTTVKTQKTDQTKGITRLVAISDNKSKEKYLNIANACLEHWKLYHTLFEKEIKEIEKDFNPLYKRFNAIKKIYESKVFGDILENSTLASKKKRRPPKYNVAKLAIIYIATYLRTYPDNPLLKELASKKDSPDYSTWSRYKKSRQFWFAVHQDIEDRINTNQRLTISTQEKLREIQLESETNVRKLKKKESSQDVLNQSESGNIQLVTIRENDKNQSDMGFYESKYDDIDLES